jgi:hypothetical protein
MLVKTFVNIELINILLVNYMIFFLLFKFLYTIRHIFFFQSTINSAFFILFFKIKFLCFIIYFGCIII